MEEKEDPGDVIMEGLVYVTASAEEKNMSQKEIVQCELTDAVEELANIFASKSINKIKDIKRIKELKTLIIAYNELIYIIDNLKDYKEYYSLIYEAIYAFYYIDTINYRDILFYKKRLGKVLNIGNKKTTI